MKQLITCVWVILLSLFVVTTTNAQEKNVFSTDLANVCSGVGVSAAQAYEKKAGVIHPVMVFVKKGEGESFTQASGKAPREWERLYPKLGETELVACLTVKENSQAQECPFDIDGTAYKLLMQNTKYDVAVYESKTGNKLGETSLDLKAGKCPTVKFFSKKEEIQEADFKESLITFIKPFVQP